MKKTIFILFFSFFLITNLSANEVIAYIDMDKILNLSKVGQKAVLDLENNHKKKIESFKKIEEKLKKKEREIISQKNILSNDEYEKKINDLRQEVRNYRKKRQESLDALTKKRIELSQNFLKKINPIIANYSDENSISLIIQKKNIVMGKTELDITDEIMNLIDEKIKTLN
tara:strand:+ start:532 stop:1044 length:513 start_codon:yes stop_codon:yes gene_type:complete